MNEFWIKIRQRVTVLTRTAVCLIVEGLLGGRPEKKTRHARARFRRAANDSLRGSVANMFTSAASKQRKSGQEGRVEVDEVHDQRHGD